MKKLRNIKALLSVLAVSFCTAGFAVACNSASTTEKSENAGQYKALSDGNTVAGLSDTVSETKSGYTVYFDAQQDGEAPSSAVYAAGETVVLPECEDKVFEGYTCPFLYWANAEDGTQVTSLTMPEKNVYLYAVYGNGTESNGADFYLTKDGYVPAKSAAQGRLSGLSLSNDGDVYSVAMTFPATPAQYSSECGLTFAAGSYTNNTFKYYLQLFVINATSTNAGGLRIYGFSANNAANAILKDVTMASLEGTAYYEKFKNYLAGSEEETVVYSVRLDKTNGRYYIGADGEELFYISVGDTDANNKIELTKDYLDHSIVGFRTKCDSVRFSDPKVVNLEDYAVTLDANGGAFEDGSNERSVAFTEYDSADTPVRTGYTFQGWYKYEDGEEKYNETALDLSSTISYDLIYYAKWTVTGANIYTLSIETGIDGYEAPDQLYYQLGDPIFTSHLDTDLYDFSRTLYYDSEKQNPIDVTAFDLSKAEVNEGVITVYAKYTKIEGTELNPYQIATAEELRKFAADINAGETYKGKYFKITAPIDLSDQAWTPIALGFAGHLDGDNQAITGVTITGANRLGFFAELNAGTLKNINLTVNITGTKSVVGGLVASLMGNVTIENCTVSGSVTATQYVGGIIGNVATTSATLKNLVNNANVTSTLASGVAAAGGILGATNDSSVQTISGCKNYGTVTAKGNFVGGVAGLLRAATGASITGCYNYGNIVAGASSTQVGGVAGCCRINMSKCYTKKTATITLGTTAKAMSDYTEAVGTAAPYVGYIAGQKSSNTVTGCGLCD